MIFVTVGSQLPFDRLIRGVDRIAEDIDDTIYAQIGAGSYEPLNFQWCRSLSVSDFNERMLQSEVVVAHAGIGSVISAQRFERPIILFPRLASYGEHRNDHQLATLSALSGRQGIYPAETIEGVKEVLQRRNLLPPLPSTQSPKLDELKTNLDSIIRRLVNGG